MSGERVRITDVSPRDGLQNEPGVITTAEKVELVRLLCRTGVDEIEVTSFVSPKWVPQLGDAVEVLEGLQGRLPPARPEPSPRPPPSGRESRSPMFSALVPNERGMQGVLDINTRASGVRIGKVSVFTAASEAFARRNINASIAESIERFKPVVSAAKANGLRVRGYVSCAIACPFEGPIVPDAVVDVSRRLVEIGIDELDIADTIGAGTPESVRHLLRAIATLRILNSPEGFTLHLHDTFGRAADCVKAALDMGVRSFDGAVSGLGGCPYASTPGRRAPGNISTQTLVRTIHDAGYETGVDLDKLEEAGRFAAKIVAEARARAAAAESASKDA